MFLLPFDVMPAVNWASHTGFAAFESVIGSWVQQELRSQQLSHLDINNSSFSRYILYRENLQAANAVDWRRDHTPFRLSADQCVSLFHKLPVGDDATDVAAIGRNWRWLAQSLAFQGVAIHGGLTGGMPNDISALDSVDAAWRKSVEVAATAGPLQQTIVDYYRARSLRLPDVEDFQKELVFSFERAGISRPADRNKLLEPLVRFSVEEINRLAWLGVIDNETKEWLLKATGVFYPDDQRLARILSQRIPSSETLVHWAGRRLWDDDIAQRLGLDTGLGANPVAAFFAQGSGVGVPQDRLPNQPDGDTDWLKLSYRASRHIVTFHDTRELQHRLRKENVEHRTAINGIAPVWTEADTRAVIRANGVPELLVDSMMNLVFEPINIRLINHIVGPYSTHPEVRAAADAAFGPGVNWIEEAMLDHGFAPPYAKVAAIGIQAQADDRDNAEKKELQKKQRAQDREMTLRQYELGIMPANAAVAQLVGQFVDEQMANKMVLLVDEKIRTDFVATATAEVKAAFLAGKLSWDQVGSQMNVLGIGPTRQAYYAQQWTWEKNDKQRMLSTGEIIAALKAGLMDSRTALARMVNLGWMAPDAIIELTLAEHEVAAAAAKAKATKDAKDIAEQLRGEREAAAELKRKVADEIKRVKEAKKKADLAEAVPFEAAAAAAKYEALALMDLKAYDKAAAKNDAIQMQIEIDKATAAYNELLLAQLRLTQQSPGEKDAIEPVGEILIPQPETDSGASETPSEPAQ